MLESIRVKPWFRTDTAKHAYQSLRHRLEVARFFVRENVYAHLLVAVGRVGFCEVDQKISDRRGYGVEMPHAFRACRTCRIT